MNELKEYVVTLHKFEDLEEFYKDMEEPGGAVYIPNRKVDVKHKRPLSRNTHYMLTDDEAALLRKDPRVAAVELALLLTIAIKPCFEQTGTFSKQEVGNGSHINWALLRCIEGTQRANWGSTEIPNQTETINFTASGLNVDVIIVDGHINPAHPEYAVNKNGTGGSRVIQVDWNEYSSAADALDLDGEPTLTGAYIYPPYVDNTNNSLTRNNNHGSHVAGIACGNSMGWARGANIYNISPYGDTPGNNLKQLMIFDYIRAFHRNKSVNEVTKIKNPTICNCSFGSELIFPSSEPGLELGPITYINNRGNAIQSSTGFTEQQMTDYGIRVYPGTTKARIPFYDAALAADIEDAIADGIIIVGAAGNSFSKVDKPGGLDYNNFINATVNGQNYAIPMHRGTAPAAAPGVICVGSVGVTAQEKKADYSNCGPRIDVYAPGSLINSSVNTDTVESLPGNDVRNSTYKMAKVSGTSMAAPQVTGVLACLLEIYPKLTQKDAMDYILHYAKHDQLFDSGLEQEDTTSLQGSPNNYLYANLERKLNGHVHPISTYFIRPSSGAVYPRVKRIRY